MHAHSRRVQISCLAVIQRVDAAWGGSIIPGRLVGKGGERKRIGIHERRGQSPRVCHWLGSTVVVFAVVQVGEVSEKVLGSQYIVVFMLNGLVCRDHCCGLVTELCDENCGGRM